MVAYVYTADRKAERPEAHLGNFADILQVDGYGGYAALANPAQFPVVHGHRRSAAASQGPSSNPTQSAASYAPILGAEVACAKYRAEPHPQPYTRFYRFH